MKSYQEFKILINLPLFSLTLELGEGKSHISIPTFDSI